MTRWLARLLAVVGGLLILGPAAPVSAACGWCVGPLPTIREEAATAPVVLYGTLQNPRGDANNGKTDLRVEAALKVDKSLKIGRVVEIPRYVPVEAKDPSHFLIFCDVTDGKLDPYRGVPLKAKEAAAYLKGALALDPKDRTAALPYYFPYLENPDEELARDAYLEFAKANEREIRQVAPKLAPDRLRAWLENPQTPVNRLGVYASMLGHCGKAEHAKVLRALLDDSEKRDTSRGGDSILAGYIMLEPKGGFAYLSEVLKDPSKDFALRYAGLCAVRFFWDSRPDVLGKKEMLEAVSGLLEQSDLADLTIDDLRKWQQWDATDRILALRYKSSHNVPIIKRSILCYALSCPNREAAVYVQEQRKKDPRMVQDAEELLKLETAVQPATSASQTTKK